MQILTPYIPKEYLALRINYCRQQLDALPEVSTTNRLIKGIRREVYVYKNHAYLPNCKTGKQLQLALEKKTEIESKLSIYEGIWNSAFIGTPPPDINPQKIRRRFIDASGESVILDRKFFDSLKHDSNPYYPEHKTIYYNGTYYRSASEAAIARFYTEQGIPFKYEPEIWLSGMKNPIYTDFVILIEELDLCKFHEHFGLKNAADYSRKTSTTYNNYSGAGMLPELDVFYTYDVDDVPFDIRSVITKLNSAVFDSLLGVDIPL
ncbi:MAG: hypothetical protein K6E12_02485 [Saccharofermentans sp.]|nr:hypothetical protein [Saccharofermentans sp.]